MAVVKTETVTVDGSQFKKVLKCSAKGVFTCEVPDYIAEELDAKTPTATNADDCLIAWRELINQYENSNKEMTPFLLFEYQAAEDISFCNGAGFAISACKVIETKTTQRDQPDRYTYRSEYCEEIDRSLTGSRVSSLSRSTRLENLLPFTEENLQFFRSVADGIKRVNDRLEKITEGSDALASFIRQGVPLLGNDSGGES